MHDHDNYDGRLISKLKPAMDKLAHDHMTCDQRISQSVCVFVCLCICVCVCVCASLHNKYNNSVSIYVISGSMV